MEILIKLAVALTAVTVLVGIVLILVFMYVLAKEVMKSYKNKPKHNSSCCWTHPKNNLDLQYSTSCKEVFYDASESGEPVTDWLTYCPHCSGKVIIL